MTEQSTESTATTESTAEEQRIASMAEINERVGKIESSIQAILGALHKPSQDVTQAKLDAPGSVAEEVQRELARREQKSKADAAEAEFTSLKATVAKLAEKTPVPPPRKIEQIMGYHG